jgi:hypothetical protein
MEASMPRSGQISITGIIVGLETQLDRPEGMLQKTYVTRSNYCDVMRFNPEP